MPQLFSRPRHWASHQAGRSTVSLAMAVAGLALIGGAILWGFFADEEWGDAPTEPIAESAVTPEAALPPAEPLTNAEIVEAEPDVPVQSPEASIPAADPIPEPETPTLTLADSDTAVRAALVDAGGGAVIEQFAANDHLLERGVGVIDNLAAGLVPYKLIPIAPPKQSFPVVSGTNGATVDPAGYRRFDGLADWVQSLDVTTWVSVYRQFAPLANDAFALLGYDEGSIEDRAEAALLQILDTPEVPVDAELVKREAVWVYADEQLEALPDLQKQLLRMGPDNLRKLQDKARDFRYALQDTRN